MDSIQSISKVLVVDDSEINLRAIGRCFRGTGYELLSSMDSKKCILAAVKELPDVILLDVLMPGIDGFTVCKKLKEIEVTKEIPVIFMTGLDDIETKSQAFEVGGADFITKPFEPHEVLLRVGNQLKLVNAKRKLENYHQKLEQIIDLRTNALKNEVEERKRGEMELERAYTLLKENQSRLVQSEKLAGIGQLAAGVAHEINNPIGYVNCNLGTLSEYSSIFKQLLSLYKRLRLAQEQGEPEQIKRLSSEIVQIEEGEDIDFLVEDIDTLVHESIDGVTKVKDIVQNLKSFARADSEEMVVCEINSGVESALKLVWNELKYKCEVVKKLGDIPPTKCHLGKLNQVFLNLLVNASHAIESEGIITIETRASIDTIHIIISDTGCGIEADHIDKMFDPFFTTKPVGVGTGLGLAISHGIITEHNGTIDVESEIGKGTAFTINIPIDNE